MAKNQKDIHKVKMTDGKRAIIHVVVKRFCNTSVQ